MNSAHGQSSTTGASFFPNAPSAGGQFLGWATGVQAAGYSELTVKTEEPISINFYTNAGSGSLNNLRMWIKDDGGATSTTPYGNPNDGFVGIGDFSSATGTNTTPQHLLHLIDKEDRDVYEQFSNKTLRWA